jgi:glycosyltransferase involved in cell wall biosynthesis
MKTSKNNLYVSVVMPTHNRAQMLSRAVKSVLAQSHKDLELIIVDDASTDETAEVVASIDDDRVVALTNPECLGGAASRNRGIEIARGEYVAFLDDDDLWLPSKLEKQVSRFAELPRRVGVIYTGHCYVSENTQNVVWNQFPINKGNVLVALLKGCITTSSTAMIRRELLHEVRGFDPELPAAQEWDLWIRLAKICEFDYVPQVLVMLYIHGKQLSTDLAGKIRARKMLLEKYLETIKQHPLILADHYKRLGVLNILSGQKSAGRKYLLKSLRTNPRSLNCLTHLGLSFLPLIYEPIVRKVGLAHTDGITFYH